MLQCTREDEHVAAASSTDESSLSTPGDADLSTVFPGILHLTPDPPKMREICQRCRRPTLVCVCSCFPTKPLQISTQVIILQHPSEVDRPLATVPLLQECIAGDKLVVIRGKRFNLHKQPLLKSVLSSPRTLLLFPGPNAVELSSIPHSTSSSVNLVVLDGTWHQAGSIYTQNPFLHTVKQVKLSCSSVSEYVIRTQPSKHGLSTLESVAHAVALLDNTPDIIEILVRPLRALCQHQLDRGAVIHHSKDHPDYVSIQRKLQEKAEARKDHST